MATCMCGCGEEVAAGGQRVGESHPRAKNVVLIESAYEPPCMNPDHWDEPEEEL